LTALKDDQAWDARIRKAERRSRGLLCASAVLAVGLGVAVVELTDCVRTPRTLEAGRLVLRDAEGRPRATLETDDQGRTALRMLGPDGAERLGLSGTTTTQGAAALEIGPRHRGLAFRAGEAGTLDLTASAGSEPSLSLGPNRLSAARVELRPETLGRLLEATLQDQEESESALAPQAHRPGSPP